MLGTFLRHIAAVVRKRAVAKGDLTTLVVSRTNIDLTYFDDSIVKLFESCNAEVIGRCYDAVSTGSAMRGALIVEGIE
jgi:hypothetical protein